MKRIVWDWNGTLFDDVEVCFNCINSLLSKHDIEPFGHINEYKEVFGFPIIDYYKKIGFDFEKTPYTLLAKEYMDAYMNKSDTCPLQKDALEALEYVKNHNMKQVILSASRKDYLLEQVNWFDIEDYFDALYGISNIYAKSKKALAFDLKNDFSNDTFYFIGDSLHDIEVAESIGAECICVTCGHQSLSQLSNGNCVIKNSLIESVEYIYGRNQDTNE